MRDYAAMAKASGFTDAAVLPVRELVVVPEYRRFCAQNLCGNYGVLPACPPDERNGRGNDGGYAAVPDGADPDDRNNPRRLLGYGGAEGREEAPESADRAAYGADACGRSDRSSDDGRRPWKHASCMSAYCVDAQRMADAVHMKCWVDDGKIRYFSLILFQSA